MHPARPRLTAAVRGDGQDGVVIVDLTEEQARRTLALKWGQAPPDVLPAWVAEMDYALAPPVHRAVQRAVQDGVTGYAAPGSSVARALAGFAGRRWGWPVDPSHVVLVGDVMAGIALALDVLCDPGPVVVPTPAYMPFLDVAQLTGRERWDLPLDPDDPHATIDLDRLDHLLAAGARTVLLSQPHNPWGRAFTQAELEALRDVVLRHGARVVSDEIHGPLVLDGARHVPYLSLDGTADHAVTVLSASKAFNTPGLKCAQVVAPGRDEARALGSVPLVRNSGMSPLGAVAARAAYDEGEEWLDALRRRLCEQRDLFAALVADELPHARLRRQEATYLAWVDARRYGLADPAGEALRTGRVWVNAGPTFGPGGEGHVRVNLATSPDRLREVVRRLAHAWTATGRPATSGM